MRQLLFIIILISGTLAYSQSNNTTGTISDGETGSSVRTTLNDDLQKGNAQHDTLVVYLGRLDNAVDSLAIHLGRLELLTDSTNDQSAQIITNLSNITNLLASTTILAATVSDHTDSIAVHLGRLDDGVDTMAVHLGRLDDGVDSLAIHLGRLDDGVDTMAVHLDTLQAHRTDLQVVTALATTYTYNATRLNVVTSDGYTGTIDSLDTVDGNVVQVEEATGAPGFDIRVSFTGVLSFNNIQLYDKYDAGALHTSHIQLWNPNTSAWVEIDEFSDDTEFTFHNFAVINGADYIDDDSVIVRIYHDDAGNPSHFIELDYLVLKQQPNIGGGGVTSHLALTAIGTITHSAIEDTITAHRTVLNSGILGGTIPENKAVVNTGESYTLDLKAGTSNSDQSSKIAMASGALNMYGYDTVNYNNPAFSKYSRVQVDGSFVGLAHYGTNSLTKAISLASGGMAIIDDVDSTGFKYDIDYSGNFTDRSIVDKAYVDAQAGSALDTTVANTLMRFKEDTVGLYLVPVGMGMPTDTGMVQTAATYGAVYHASPDTLNVTQARMICLGTNPDFYYQVYWGADITTATDSLFAGPVEVAGAETTTTGELDTATNNAKIPPDVYLWWKVNTITTKPTMMSLNLIGSNISGN